MPAIHCYTLLYIAIHFHSLLSGLLKAIQLENILIYVNLILVVRKHYRRAM